MANHVSNLDPPALIPLIPGRTSAFYETLADEICRCWVPASGKGSLSPWIAAGNAANAQASVAEAGRLLAKGVHMTTFVEGTRSRTAA
jgi:1-acyl-sn-glycerol-3-phosphate acyltransferase